MILVKWALFYCVAAMTMLQSAWAITPAVDSGGTSTPLTSTSATIERGGMITAISFDKGTVAIDGVTYPLAIYFKVHAANGLETSRQNLREGVPIRFSTVKDTVGGKERIVEIWIANGNSRLPKK